MIRTIAQKEFTTALRDKRFVILGLIILLLLLAAALTGIKSYSMLQEERSIAQQTASDNFQRQPDRHPHRVAHYGAYAFRPKSTISFLDFGLDSFTGTMVYLEAHQQNSANFSVAQQSGSLIRFGEMTVAFVMQLLIPLLIIFLCFNTFTIEKEEGTLKVLLSQGVALSTIANAKILGYSRLLALILIPAFLFVTIFMLSLNAFSWNSDLLLRTGIFIISYVAYFFIFITGAVLVSALNMHSRTALVTLLGIWMLTGVLLPKITANLGSALYETPSKAAMDAAVHHEAKAGMNGHDPQDKRVTAFKDSLLKKYGVDSLSQLPVNVDGLIMAEGEAFSSKIYQQRFEALVGTYEKQNQISVWSGFINPYQSIRAISMSMAGADFRHYVHFLNAAENYRYQLAQYLNNLQATRLAHQPKDTRLNSSLWKNYPEFSYEAPSAGWAIQGLLIPLIALSAWTVLLYFLAIFLIKNRTYL